MILPIEILEKIKSLYNDLETKNLKNTRQNLTMKYKHKTGQSRDLVSNENESVIYAVSRMPATYAVIYNLIFDLINQGFISDEISSVFDVGSGTGSGYFAIKNILSDVNLELFEKNEDMISVFKYLSDCQTDVKIFDLISDNFSGSADLVMTSYVLSELTKNDRVVSFEKLLKASNKYVLIIDTGTPESYKYMMELCDIAKNFGFSVAAPCMCDKCPLKNDYCQFYTRVERTSLMRQAKSGTLPYEDEKYFYILFTKLADEISKLDSYRIIRRPTIRTNEISLMVCSKNGVFNKSFTKKDKENYKLAKKLKINHLFNIK